MPFAVWLRSALPEYKVSAKRQHCLSIHSLWLCTSKSTSKNAWKSISGGYCGPYVAVRIGSAIGTTRVRPGTCVFYYYDGLTLSWRHIGVSVFGDKISACIRSVDLQTEYVAVISGLKCTDSCEDQKKSSTCCIGLRFCLRLRFVRMWSDAWPICLKGIALDEVSE